MKRAPRNSEPAKRWLAFLRNHQEAITAMDFFAVPTITFGVLYCFSWSLMIGGGFCTSTSPKIRRACGLFSSFGKLFRPAPLPDF